MQTLLRFYLHCKSQCQCSWAAPPRGVNFYCRMLQGVWMRSKRLVWPRLFKVSKLPMYNIAKIYGSSHHRRNPQLTTLLSSLHHWDQPLILKKKLSKWQYKINVQFISELGKWFTRIFIRNWFIFKNFLKVKFGKFQGIRHCIKYGALQNFRPMLDDYGRSLGWGWDLHLPTPAVTGFLAV